MALSPIARLLALDSRPGWTGTLLEVKCAQALEALGLRPDAWTRTRRRLLEGVLALGLVLQGAGSFGLVPFEIYGPAVMVAVGALVVLSRSRGFARSLLARDGSVFRPRLETEEDAVPRLVLVAETAEWARDLPCPGPDEASAIRASPRIVAEVATLVVTVAGSRRTEILLGEDGANLARGWILMGNALGGLERRGATILANQESRSSRFLLALLAGVAAGFAWGPMAGITVAGILASIITLPALGSARRQLRLRDLDGELLLATDRYRDPSYTLDLNGPQGEASGTVEIRGLTDEELVVESHALLDAVLDRVAAVGHLAARTPIR